MSDINGIMNLAGQALLTQQQAISVTSHNIANVNTPGYSRQQLIMTTDNPLDSSVGPMGNGVRAEAIERIYDRFLSAQINNENQRLGRWEAQKVELSIPIQLHQLSQPGQPNQLNQPINTINLANQ